MTTNKPEVKRYDMSACPDHICRVFNMEESEDGDFVEWETYEALQAELKHAKEWRDLAMQFDRHRMSAISLLRALLDGTATEQDCHEFLRAPPLSALEITERVETQQAECEKLKSELDSHKAARIAYASEFPLDKDGNPDVGSIHQNIRTLKAECDQLRKDAEFGRSVLTKREPGKKYGCHCDLEEGMEPDGCVIDINERHNCIHAAHIDVKEQCKYWTIIATDQS